MDFIKLLKRFIPPYKKEVALNILFNLLSTLFSLVSFAAIIPILQILFGLSDNYTAYQIIDWSQKSSDIIAALKNNLFYWIQIQTENQGAGWILLALGFFLIPHYHDLLESGIFLSQLFLYDSYTYWRA